MKVESLPQFQKLGLRPDEAAHALGSVNLFKRMVRAKWIVPVVKGSRCTLYDVNDVAYAFQRLKRGDHLPG